MRSIIIDPEFRDLIPPLAPQELEQLHNSLCGDGCLSPLIVWREEGILVDGHNRHAWLTKHDRPFDIKEMSFSNREEVRRFIILNQLGRRNVTPETASMLRAEYHASMNKGVGGNRGNQHTLPNLENQGLAEASKTTAAIVAEQTGVSESTVEADVRLMKALDKLGIPRTDYAAGKVRDAKGKKRSKASILAEAFPPKEKPKALPQPAPVEADESDTAADDEVPIMQSIVIEDDQDQPSQTPKEPEPELEPWTIILMQLPKITKQQRQDLFEILANRWDCKPAR